jgi:hypothetical protein
MNNVVPQPFVQSLMNPNFRRVEGLLREAEKSMEILSWFMHKKRHKSVNQLHRRAITISPDENLRQLPDLKFTKRNYNEAVLIREATQEQYNKNFIRFEADLIKLNLWQNPKSYRPISFTLWL